MNNNKYEQFLFEKKLAKKLLNSNMDERRIAYKSLYSEFFTRFPEVAYDPNNNNNLHKLEWQIKFLKPLLTKDTVFLEIGAGNCLLSIEVAKYVKQVIAYEVADAIPHIENKPENLVLKIFDGVDLFELDDSVDIIYSNQVFEHLHIEDTLHHLQQYYKILKRKGQVAIVTPNSLNGPHDISRNFSTKPEGFHMKEYLYQDIRNLARKIGFNKAKGFLGHKKIGYWGFNVFFFIAFEKAYSLVPRRVRYNIKNSSLLGNLLGIKILIRK